MRPNSRINHPHGYSFAGKRERIAVEVAQTIDKRKIDWLQFNCGSGCECNIYLQAVPEPVLAVNIEALDLLTRATEREGYGPLFVCRSLGADTILVIGKSNHPGTTDSSPVGLRYH